MSRQILETVCAELKECNAITSNREFCVSWLAKDESYLRVLRHHQTQPSADALAICASKLGYYALHLGKSEKPEHEQWVARFEELDLSRFDAAPLIAFTATKEIDYGTETDG